MKTDWETARERSQDFPCPYVAVSTKTRKRSDGEHRLACGAQVGETCRVPGTDQPLRGQAAHRVRQVLAGVAAEHCLSAAYTS